MSFSASDDGGSGVARTYYSAGGSPFTLAPSAAIPVGAQAEVSFYSVDNAGNIEPLQTATSGYRFQGFFSPVDNPPIVNVMNAGRAVPLKFSLGGNLGLQIFAAGSPSSQAVDCSSGAPTDLVEQTTSAGGSSLSYDAATDLYTYVWKTSGSWEGTCRMLTMKLADGTSATANFKFT